MSMNGYIFAIRKQNNDIHSTVFNHFTALKIKDFTPNQPETKPLVFYVQDQFIICRTNAQVNGIPCTNELFDFNENDHLTGSVTLPRDLPKLIFTKKQFDEFVEKNRREPTYKEQHKFCLLSDEEVPEYAQRLLARAGIDATKIKFNDSSYQLVSGRRKAIKGVEIHFEGKVSDLEKLKAAWFNGIGRNKTYGFGMLRAVKL